MLCLGRKYGQAIVMDLPTGERITVWLIEERTSGARIGIDAPKDVVITRSELLAAPIPSPISRKVHQAYSSLNAKGGSDE